MNDGKKFEQDWKSSLPQDVYYLRLHDPAQAFSRDNAVTRFSSHNPFDCVLYRYPHFYTLELKSTKLGRFTFWREDLDNAKQCMIKKWQIAGLYAASEHAGAISGFVLNFRALNRTYFLEVNMLLDWTKELARKSINEQDVIDAGGILIAQKKLKVNWRYDVEGFLDVTGRYESGKHAGATDNKSDAGIQRGAGKTRNRTGKRSSKAEGVAHD